MSSNKFVVISACALGAVLLIGVVAMHAAQGSTATILGTVTDSSGAAIPDAAVRVTNAGTGAVQLITSDAQGRYRLTDLPIGEYEVRAEKAGFQTLDKKGISLTVGSDTVVDFPLSVGQITQSVTVEADVTQVETTSAAVSTLIEPTQMRELPLNGRNFEQLILLSPGVTIHQAIGYQAVNGTGNSYSVSGSRSLCRSSADPASGATAAGHRR